MATCALVTMSPPEFQMTPDPNPRWRPEDTRTVERRNRSEISPNPPMSVPPRPFADHNLHRSGCAAADDVGFDGLSHRKRLHGVLHVLRFSHSRAVERHQDIADQDAGFGRGSIL